MKPLAQESTRADGKGVRQRRLDAVVISRDDGFLIELGPLLGDRYRTRIIESAEAVDSAIGSARWLAIIDAASIPDSRLAVTLLEQQHGSAPIIVIAEESESWAAAVTRGTVVACVQRDAINDASFTEALAAAEQRLEHAPGAERPESPDRLASPDRSASPERSASLERSASPDRSASLNRYSWDLDSLIAGAGDADSDAASALAAPSGINRPVLITGAVILVAGLLALGGWLWYRAGASNPPVAPPPAATSDNIAEPTPAPQPQDVMELLSAARVAIRDQKLLPRADGEPHGDSALELYAQALLQEPSNDEALDGAKRLFAVGRTRIQTDLAGGKLEDANRILALFKNAGIDPDAWHDVESSIAAARPKWLASRAQESIAAGDYATAEQIVTQLTTLGADRSTIAELRRALEGKKADQQLQGLANEVKSAIEAGSLLDPANDNARTRLQALRNINRNHPITLAAQREVQSALVARAQEATRKDQFDQAQRLLGAAAELGSTADVADAKRQLQTETELVSLRAAAAESKARESAAAATTAAAAAPAGASQPATGASFIPARPLQPLDVVYPVEADRNHIEGYAIVEFMLRADGRAVAPTVIEASPANVFNHAAVAAVSRGRYDTKPLVDGQPMRARIKLTFKRG